MSVRIDIDLQGVERLNRGIERMRGLGRNRALFEVIGGVVESQTRNRIRNEKTDPDGNAWIEWSEAYAKTREGDHSLLMNKGYLEDSFAVDASADSVSIGTNIDYAARQHEMRPYLGLSEDNWDELAERIDGFISGLLQ